MNGPELDLETLLNDSNHSMEDFSNVRYSTQSEIDEVLNNALAEIDENQMVIDQELAGGYNMSHQNNILPGHQKQVFDDAAFSESLEIKPLTPESIFANDESLLNTPINGYVKTFNGQQQQQNMISENNSYNSNHTMVKEPINEELIQKNKELETELQKYKKLFESRTQNLEKAMLELKKSEILRLELMEENRTLKTSLSKFVFHQDMEF